MSQAQYDLVTVGNALTDHFHRVTDLPLPGSGAFILGTTDIPGGVEGNVAVAASKLGLRTGVIARVGDDERGHQVLEDFASHSVDTARIQVGEPGETAYSLIFVDPSGQRIIISGGRGVRGLSLSVEDDQYLLQARACFASGYLPLKHLRRIISLRQMHGRPLIAFDLPGNFDDLEPRGLSRADLDGIISEFDVFMTNTEGLMSYTGASTIDDGFNRLRSKGVSRASVSDGADGVHLMELKGGQVSLHHVPAVPTEAVDTSGAGDVLHAGLIAEWLLAEKAAVDAAKFAVAAAAISCRSLGVRHGLPDRFAVEALANSQ